MAAFGVPDDAVYDTFEFSKFFRKNINLIASVIPDPDTVGFSVVVYTDRLSGSSRLVGISVFTAHQCLWCG